MLSFFLKKNQTISNLYLLNIQDNSVEELTKPSFNTSDSGPFFLDDEHVAYFHYESESTEEVVQLYVLDLKNREEGPYRLTNFPIAFGNIKYNVDRKLLAFSASVYSDDGTLEGTLKKDKEIESTKKDTALVFDQLMVR
jgi:Tol biopolymer transport system component